MTALRLFMLLYVAGFAWAAVHAVRTTPKERPDVEVGDR